MLRFVSAFLEGPQHASVALSSPTGHWYGNTTISSNVQCVRCASHLKISLSAFSNRAG